MARLIDANALKSQFLNYVRTEPHFHWGDWQNMCIHGTEIDEVIANAPTVDAVEVVHGRWQERRFICMDSKVMLGYRCSRCMLIFDAETNYCPNCGAKMDGGNEDD